jgi:ubiquitin-conjugating enzyme E2 variant
MLTPLACCQVDPSKLPCLANWKRDYTMETILIELRRYV